MAQSQSLQSACTATCLDVVTSPISVQTPKKAKSIGVCNMVPADTAYWWVFRPSGTTFSFSFQTSGCTCPLGGVAGADVVVYSGTDCSTLTKIECKQGVSGSFSLSNLTPCKMYWIQVGSTSPCQCNVKLTYNVNQLFKTINPITITGAKVVCKDATATFTANGTIPCSDDRVFRWSIAQGSAVINDIGNNSVEIFFKKEGKVKICVEPNYAPCFPTITKTCYEVEVIDIKDPTENLQICAENLPYTLDLKSIIQKTNPTFNKDISPTVYEVKEAPGTKKIIAINYTVTGANCAEKINLNLEVYANKKVTLPSQLLAEGEQKTIKGEVFTCVDVRPTPISFVVDSKTNGKACDSTFTISLQCIKVTPIVSPKAALLDCVTKTATLDASKSTTLPTALPTGKSSTGIRSYLWSNGATTSKITVSQGGVYTVTVTYTYKWLSPTGFITRTLAKTASAFVIGSANNKPATPLPIVSKTTPCVGDTTLYYQPKVPNVTYSWSIKNGTILGSPTADSVWVTWNGNSPKQLCVKLSAPCGVGNDTCLVVQTSSVIPKTPQVILDLCIATDKFRFAVVHQANITHYWKVKGGTLTNTIGDSVTVTWTTPVGRSLCVHAVADCTISLDTCVVHNPIKPERLGEFKVDKGNNSFSPKVFEMNIIPNPANDLIEVRSNRNIEHYIIFDSAGRSVLETSESVIDIKQLEKGIYHLKGIDSTKEVKVLKFIKI